MVLGIGRQAWRGQQLLQDLGLVHPPPAWHHRVNAHLRECLLHYGRCSGEATFSGQAAFRLWVVVQGRFASITFQVFQIFHPAASDRDFAVLYFCGIANYKGDLHRQFAVATRC